MNDEYEEGPRHSLAHAAERLTALRRIAADALQLGDVARAQAALERSAAVELELETMYSERPPQPAE